MNIVLENYADEPMVIETDLTDEEHKLIEESVNRYHANPGSFVSFDKIAGKVKS